MVSQITDIHTSSATCIKVLFFLQRLYLAALHLLGIPKQEHQLVSHYLEYTSQSTRRKMHSKANESRSKHKTNVSQTFIENSME